MNESGCLTNLKPISTTEQTMTIGFWTPYLKSKRGNSTTARRIINGLRDGGYHVEVFAYEEDVWDSSAKARMNACDVHHILHFYRFALWKNRFDHELEQPFLMTSGGTDVHQNLLDSSHKCRMYDLVKQACAITVFTVEAASLLKKAYPDVSSNIRTIPQSVWFPEGQGGMDVHPDNGRPNVLLPAGLRKVKDVLYVFEALKLLQNRYPMLKFTIVGEPLEEDVYKEVEKLQREHSWVKYINGVPLESMHQLYDWADIVINTSVSEGQPLAIMEAMMLGRPVLARGNAGNCSLIDDGINGFIYENGEDFKDLFIRMMEDGGLRRKLSMNAIEKANREFSIGREIEHYEQLYLKCMERTKKS